MLAATFSWAWTFSPWLVSEAFASPEARALPASTLPEMVVLGPIWWLPPAWASAPPALKEPRFDCASGVPPTFCCCGRLPAWAWPSGVDRCTDALPVPPTWPGETLGVKLLRPCQAPAAPPLGGDAGGWDGGDGGVVGPFPEGGRGA